MPKIVPTPRGDVGLPYDAPLDLSMDSSSAEDVLGRPLRSMRDSISQCLVVDAPRTNGGDSGEGEGKGEGHGEGEGKVSWTWLAPDGTGDDRASTLVGNGGDEGVGGGSAAAEDGKYCGGILDIAGAKAVSTDQMKMEKGTSNAPANESVSAPLNAPVKEAKQDSAARPHVEAWPELVGYDGKMVAMAIRSDRPDVHVITIKERREGGAAVAAIAAEEAAAPSPEVPEGYTAFVRVYVRSSDNTVRRPPRVEQVELVVTP